MKTRQAVSAALLTALLWLPGCGFQLQGRQVLPPVLEQARLETADRQSEFTRALRAQLTASGGRLVEPAPATTSDAARDEATGVAVVRILRDEVTERVLSVDARNIPTDYELTYAVEIEVRAGARELLPAEKFELSRIYSFDERRQLAKEREKEMLRDALARDLASVVTRRLSTLQ
jgi:outer membrane lipopolysaccharide assembly protein LptE/RlpB